MKVDFDHICALIIFVACCLMLVFHIDGEVKATMTLAVGYLLGTGYQSRKRKGG